VIRMHAARLALAATLGLTGSAAFAQQPQPAVSAKPGDEIFKMVDAYIVSNVQEGLGLTDDQFAKLVPLVKHLQNDRRAFNQRRRSLIRELRSMFESGTATEARVTDLLKELKTLESDSPALIKKDQDGLDAVLTPVQQAKYRVLESDVDQRIRGIMTRLGQQPRPGARAPQKP
jgi:Spy/CpxP family protein refolding chaperone